MRLIFLDSGPLGLMNNARGLPSAGVRVFVPEVADDEVRRKLLHLGAGAGVRRLDQLEAGLESCPITTDVMVRAAELWGDLRRSGLPTASPGSLDGDCLLAAQALMAVGSGDVMTVATENVGHLGRLVDARRWELITGCPGERAAGSNPPGRVVGPCYRALTWCSRPCNTGAAVVDTTRVGDPGPRVGRGARGWSNWWLTTGWAQTSKGGPGASWRRSKPPSGPTPGDRCGDRPGVHRGRDRFVGLSARSSCAKRSLTWADRQRGPTARCGFPLAGGGTRTGRLLRGPSGGFVAARSS